MGKNTDRELLELTAKAAGIELDYRRGSDAYYYDDTETGREEWYPLGKNGQAFWLAVKLGLVVTVDLTLGGETEAWLYGNAGEPFPVNHNEDPYAATRRAIVLAAAEIGKGKK